MNCEDGNCDHCKRKAHTEKIKNVLIWTVLIGVNVAGLANMIYSKAHPIPKTAEELALDAKIGKLGNKLDTAQTAYDAAVEERDGPPQSEPDEQYPDHP